MSSKILITGVAGFIGSNMCDFLLKKNYEIVGVDNLITGSIKNLDKFKSNERFTFIKHNICEPLRMNLRVDKILHFASPASPSDYLKYPIETLRVNSIGTENILKLAVINKASVLVASTSEIYGDPKEHPQEESYFGNVNPIGPRGAYDEGKGI